MQTFLKCILAVLLSVGVFCWRFRWGTREQASWFHQHAGYWWMWSLLVFLAYTAFDAGPPVAQLKVTVKSLIKSHRTGLLVVLGCSAFLHAHEPHEFRVLYDEPSHLQLSQMMHLEGQAMVAARSHYIGDHLIFVNQTAPFRQYFFSFLLSLGHNLFGYSPSSPFVLNALLGALLLLLIYFAAQLNESPVAGIAAVLLFTALPLLAQIATSGAYDILNLCFITALPIVAFKFVSAVSGSAGKWLNLLVAIAWGASQVRYESLLFFLAVLGFIALRRMWMREWVITWPLALTPVALVPSFASNMILMKTDSLLLPTMRKAGESFIGLDHLWSNFQDLLVFFYSYDAKSIGSVFVAVLGTLGCLVLITRVITKIGKDPYIKHLVTLSLTFLIIAVAYVPAMLSFWGSPLDGQAARFTLSLWSCFALGGGWLVSQVISRWKAIQPIVLTFMGLVIIISSARASAGRGTTDLLVPSRVERWLIDFAGHQDRFTTLFVSKSNMELMSYNYASITIDMMNASPEKCLQILQAGVYKNIFILERSEFPKSKESNVKKDAVLVSSRIVVEEVASRSFAPGQVSQILKFIGYRLPDGKVVSLSSAPPLINEFENDITRNAYIFSLYP